MMRRSTIDQSRKICLQVAASVLSEKQVEQIAKLHAREMRLKRTNPDSVICHDAERLKKEGRLKNEKKIFTDDDNHVLGEMYIVEKQPFDEIQKYFCRSVNAIKTKLLTMSGRRQKRSGRVYVPPGPSSEFVWKSSRKGKHYSLRDKRVLKYATGKVGLENGGYRPEYISLVLRRDPDDVRSYMRKRIIPTKGLLNQVYEAEKKKVENMPDEQLAIIFHAILIIELQGRSEWVDF